MTSKQKVKILIVCGKSPKKSHGGGYASYALALEKSLIKLGFLPEIIASGSKITALPYLPIYSAIFAYKIIKYSQAHKFDRVIVWGIGPWGFAGILAKPFIASLKLFTSSFTTIKHELDGSLSALDTKDYGIYIKTKYYLFSLTAAKLLSFLERITFKSSDHIFINYNSTEKILSKEYKIPKNKFIRTPSLIFPLKKTYKPNHSGNTILTVCRQDARKGINYLLHAFKILKDENVDFRAIIIGDGEMLELNKKLALKLGLRHSVQFLSYVHNLEVFVEKSSIFCHPSIEEGSSSISIIEAMQIGFPIVTTDIDGISEDLKDNYSALLVPPKDATAISAAIEKLIKNKKLRKKLGSNARETFLKKHNYSRTLRELNLFLQKVTNK